MRPVGPEGHREKLWLGNMKGQERPWWTCNFSSNGGPGIWRGRGVKAEAWQSEVGSESLKKIQGKQLGNLQPISGKTPAYLRCQDHGTTTKDSGRYGMIWLESMRETIYFCRGQSQKWGAFQSIWRQENHESQALGAEQLTLLELVLFDLDCALIFFLK